LFKTTLPPETLHDGWVMVPTTGADGVAVTAFIIALADEGDEQPDALETIKLYVPGLRSSMAVVVPVPVDVIAPGFLVSFHVPDAGKPLSSTVPFVVPPQEGCVMASTIGAVGAEGTLLSVTFCDVVDKHPVALATVKL
jgi:hypothetical protein